MNSVSLRLLALAVMICFAGTGATYAQALQDRIPGDAMVYVGWSGAKALQAHPDYAESHFKAVSNLENMEASITSMIDGLARLVEKEEPGEGEQIKKFTPVLVGVLNYPTAIYVGLPEFPEAGPPVVPFALLVEAGADAKEIYDALQVMQAEGGNDQVAIHQVGPYVGMTSAGLGDQHLARLGLTMKRIAPVPALATNVSYLRSRDAIRVKSPAWIGYVDLQQIRQLFEKYLGSQTTIMWDEEGNPTEVPAEHLDQWLAVSDALGLKSIQNGMIVSGLAGKNWSHELLITAPAPRAGLLGRMGRTGVNPELLKVIPASAYIAGVMRFDLASLFDEMRLAAKKVEPDTDQQLDAMIAQIKEMTGIDVEAGFIRALGADWAYYTDRTVNGNGLMGLTLINQPKNLKALQQTMTQATAIINAVMHDKLAQQNLKVQLRTTEYRGLTVSYLAIPLVSPAWAFQDDRLIVGLFPQTVVGVAARMKAGGESLPVSRDFLELAGAGTNAKMLVYSFADTVQLADTGYQNSLMMSRLFTGFMDIVGVQTDPMVIPPLAEIRPHLGRARSAVWMDDVGVRVRSIETFPGSATMFSFQSSLYSSQMAMMASVLLPSISQAKGISNRTKSAGNMRTMLMGMMAYRAESAQYPADLGILLEENMIDGAQFFIHPSSNKQVPDHLNKEQLGNWIRANTDYVYVRPDNQKEAGATTVLLYEKFGPGYPWTKDGIYIGFGDGHVELYSYDEALRLLKKQGLIE